MPNMEDENNTGDSGVRHARMRLETTVLLSRGNEAFPTELEDISATGVLLRRPKNWPGKQGETWILDMIFARDLHINLDAEVARVNEQWVGMAYARIPDDKQEALWNLLGVYADRREVWSD